MTRVAFSMALLLSALCALLMASSTQAFAITAATPKISLTASGTVQLGLLVTPPQAGLKALTIETIVDTEGKTIASDVQATGDGTKFVASVDALDAGLYKMKVSGEDATTKEAVYEVVPFKVTVPAKIATLKINDKAVATSHKLDSPVLSSAGNDGLVVEVELQNALTKTPVLAHQAFLRFTHSEDQTQTYFVLAADASAKTHKAVLNMAALGKKFSYKSGVHAVQLIMGDAKFDAAIVCDLGTVELLLAAAPPAAPSPLYAKTLLHESDTTLHALKEIKHIMRTEDTRPPIVVSFAFTGAVLLPLAGFLLYVLKLQLNISKLFSGSVFVFGVGFLASLAAILVLFGLYWIEFTMFQTLGYLAVLSVAAMVFGHFTLKKLAHASVTSKTKKE